MLRNDLIAAGLGLEALGDDVQIGTVPAAEPIVEPVIEEPVPGELEEALVESAQATDALEKTEEVLSDLQETSATLESIQELLQDSLKFGGLQPIAARAVDLAVTTSLRSAGIHNQRVLPALESFGGIADRRDTTVASLEAVNEWSKKITEAIKAIIAKVKEAFKNFFDSEDKKLAIIARWSDAIIAKTKDQTQREGNFVAGSELTYLGKHDVSAIDGGFRAARKALLPSKSMGKAVGEVIEDTLSKIISVLGKVSASIATVDDAQEATKVKEMLVSFKENLGTYKMDGFIGVEWVELNYDGFEVKRPEDEKNDLPLLSPSDTKKIASGVKETLVALRDARKMMEKGISEWESTVSGLQKQLEKTSDKTSAPANLMSIVGWNKSFIMGRTIMYSVTQSCFTALKYCAASQGKGTASQSA